MLVITGISGAGRSTAAHTLEDAGWYVVDNIPPNLLGPLVDLVARAPQSMPKLAVIIDIRGKALFADFKEALDVLQNAPVEFTMLFLDATDETIIARYEAQRRPHPLQGNGRILDGIRAERDLLADLKERADVVLDTTKYNVHELSTVISQTYSVDGPSIVNITVMSFGFKYGVPADANFVADVRFIPNPHWIAELRPHTGQDAPVRDFVLGNDGANQFVDLYVESLKPVIDGYRTENKHYATIAVGCTGGKHRSVAVTEEITRRLGQLENVTVNFQHRDLGRE
ncbi:RNase adapter RapZ [Kocuria koreensis]|uniref:RNase adapter RapZ n=2 Tax=Rothia koreensis TaxID=592378 RepID=A0A7K1LGF2_9MICC|nr:RNase adapter RapZ [Rothia koreensis]MUN54277.1 RNase adapter RapZ [Rothia koreensis]